MKRLDKGFVKRLFFSFDGINRRLFDNNNLTHPVYEKLILPFEATVYQMGNYKLTPTFKKKYKKALERYMPDWRDKDKKYLRRLEKDIVKAHICNHMSAEEYFLYDLEHQDYWQRWEWFSDKDLLRFLRKRFGQDVFDELTDKSFFYQLTKQFFRRDLCFVGKDFSIADFISFTRKHPRFIIKPINGSFGANTFVTSVSGEEDANAFFHQMSDQGNWVVEELVVQHPETAVWNESSVNTVRVPSFRTPEGVYILQPFFRTGRKGSIVDNAGQGGVFAVFDPETGVITTDGVNEFGGRYPTHPDSGIRFKGWQIPYWKELKSLVAEVHQSLPEHHRYVGFDFALNKDGQWVLIEGNWGQMVGQMAELKGIRRQFIEHITS